MRPSDHRNAGMYVAAPWSSVMNAMIAAVAAPKTTSGSDPSYVRSRFATEMVPKKMPTTISAPTAKRMIPR
jgi:hypothetical protein